MTTENISSEKRFYSEEGCFSGKDKASVEAIVKASVMEDMLYDAATRKEGYSNPSKRVVSISTDADGNYVVDGFYGGLMLPSDNSINLYLADPEKMDSLVEIKYE